MDRPAHLGIPLDIHYPAPAQADTGGDAAWLAEGNIPQLQDRQRVDLPDHHGPEHRS